ncbi:major capsid protein [Gordonia phage Gmala1]|uniref:Major capsid protein n=3 Tax=Gordtnkvirus gordtnk2 TaxID=1982219 RepID=A0A0E3T814_9CAUD|nr:major capsid protein [Gordonia phage Gmala1]YP_009222460.1 major capsid protein [Gordonia phage GordDuk1]YP_009223915.1 major capsid protein [Gordonia phage GordTnk2]AKC02747.1 major capsid protein [Gordonia phage GordTnk2]AKC02845.1 major capsid protein [Gordonia phage Gmala1]AKC02935.1 major capsid protein [Gordonia phage GordDuk1]
MASMEMGLAPNAAADFSSGVVPLKELMARRVHLGIVRELTPPEGNIGLNFVPFMDVEADDVIMDYLRGTGSGLAPAVSPDAEAELFQDSDDVTGQIKASIMDWRLKSRYSATDIHQYFEAKQVLEDAAKNGTTIPTTTLGSLTKKIDNKVARDTVRRKQALDNRIEWLIMKGLVDARIQYDDGKIKFDVDFKRPAGNVKVDGVGGVDLDYSSDTHDPINQIIAQKQAAFDDHGVDLSRMLVSRKFANSLFKSSKFMPRTGFAPSAGVDPKYVLEGWGPKAAIDIIQRECDVELIINDNVFRQRNPLTGVIQNVRYQPENEVLFLPNEAQIAAYDDTELGFGKILTSPHPMNDFNPGWYAWETETTDPWVRFVGTGIKAFPVLPHMELTYKWTVDLG